jgi:hypothetical protein
MSETCKTTLACFQQQTTGYTSEHRGKQSSPSENMNEGRDKKRSIGEAGDFNNCFMG